METATVVRLPRRPSVRAMTRIALGACTSATEARRPAAPSSRSTTPRPRRYRA